MQGVRCTRKVKSSIVMTISAFSKQKAINKKVQLDATVYRHLLTAKSLYMFRVSQHPSSGALKL